jgi:hypothetical protein
MALRVFPYRVIETIMVKSWQGTKSLPAF